jgi:DNA replication protein DnaC
VVCERCHGTGFEIVERDGREFAQPCPCRRKGPAGGDDVVAACRIPPRYEHCTLESFEPGSPSLLAAHEKAVAFCEGYPHLDADEGLGLLWDFHALIREIKSSYDPETKTTELMVLQPVVETDVLVLDDLGAWKMTDWMNDTLFDLVNSRYMAKRPTVITTNYQDVTREEVLAADPLRRREFLVERIGQRLRSRLMEMCLVVRIQGSDHRQARQLANQVALRRP